MSHKLIYWLSIDEEIQFYMQTYKWVTYLLLCEDNVLLLLSEWTCCPVKYFSKKDPRAAEITLRSVRHAAHPVTCVKVELAG